MKDFPTNEVMEARLVNSFSYHAPMGDQAERYERLRAAGLDFAREVVRLTPPSREQSLAITAIEEAVMRANQSVALNPIVDVMDIHQPVRGINY